MENKELLLQILQNTEDLKAKTDNMEADFNARFLNIESRLDSIEKNHDERFANIESRLDYIEKNHGERLQNIEKNHGEKLQSIEKTHGERLQNIEKTHGERLQNIENIVTRIEKEHEEKIQVLFDYFVDQDSKNKKMNSKINKLFKKSDEHDAKIFALEFYKAEKLASK